MSNQQIPACFCPLEKALDCDWVVEIDMKYYNKNYPDDLVRSRIPWTLDNIPQPLAQVILQTVFDAVNRNGAEVYLEWLAGCVDNGKDNAIYKSVNKIMKNRGLELSANE